jgi:hypothetical protein
VSGDQDQKWQPVGWWAHTPYSTVVTHGFLAASTGTIHLHWSTVRTQDSGLRTQDSGLGTRELPKWSFAGICSMVTLPFELSPVRSNVSCSPCDTPLKVHITVDKPALAGFVPCHCSPLLQHSSACWYPRRIDVVEPFPRWAHPQ